MRRHLHQPARIGFTFAVSVTALAAAALSLCASPALAAPGASVPGAISGTVTAAVGGAAVSGVSVDIYDTSGDFVSSAFTASDGTYSVTGLTPESYTVCFDASSGSGGSSTTGYASQCYKNDPWSGGNPPAGTTPVAVASGQTVAGIDADLLADGEIGGTVTASVGGAGLSGVSVDVYDASGNFVASGSTASDGTYTITGLTPSTTGYTVCFDASFATGGSSATGYQSQCYKDVIWTPGTTPPAGTTPVTVSSGAATTGIGAALTAQGAISGTVTAASGGAGVSNVAVEIFTQAGVFVTEGDTASDGTYTVSGLPPATAGYTVCFDASFATGGSSTTGYASQCYKNVVWSPGSNPPAGTTAVTVSSGAATAGIGAALTAQGAISGTVTAASGGAGVSGVSVEIYDASANFITSASTASNGAYTITGLTPSATGYRVCFDASFATGGSSTTGYASQCYKNVAWSPGSNPPAGATAIPVASGKTVTGISASLTAQGAISGTATAASGGAGVSGVSVEIYNASGNIITSTTTASNGTYTITGLTPSATGYAVCFDASFATGGSSTTGYASQCYKNAAWSPGSNPPAGATLVKVTAGKAATGISASLTANGAISGTVTSAGAGGSGVGDVTVEILNPAGVSISTVITASDGTYRVTGLPPSASGYAVCFDAEFGTGGGAATGYASQCYKNIAWTPGFPPPAGTTLVKVAAGTTATGISASLTADGAISGTVTAASGGAPVSNASVFVYDSTGNFLANASTAPDGTYTVTGLSPSATGDTVCFNAASATGGGSATGYQNQCYKNVPWTGATLPAGTTPVPVTSGTTATGINASLAADGAISGTVTAGITGGTGISDVSVDIYGANGAFTASSATASDGTYTVPGLLPSATGYTVCFDPSEASGGGSATGYQGQCYQDVAWAPDSPPPSGVTAVPVTAGNTATGIDAALAPAGGISGMVTAASGGAGVNNVDVRIFNADDEDVADSTSNAAGQYSVTGLAPSVPYTVCFDATGASGGSSKTGYQSQCYNKVAWDGGFLPPAGTTAVSVAAAMLTQGINAGLAPAGGISGTVTAASGGAAISDVTVDVSTNAGTYVAQVATSNTGSYSVTGLPPSAAGYTVCFDASSIDSTSGGYESQCYKNVPWSPGTTTPPGTTAVPVSVGAFTIANAKLATEPGISGTVTSAATGAALQGVNVRVFDDTGAYLISVTTGSNGKYIVTGLAQTGGGYIVCFDASAVDYASQCEGKIVWAGGYVPPVGVPPVQVSGASPATVNTALAGVGSIAGKVTAGDTSKALAGVTVDVYDSGHSLFTSAVTGPDGTYTVTGLPKSAAGYLVCFDGSTAQTITFYASQCDKNVPWTRGASLPSGVTAVPVAVGKTTAGIDAVLPVTGSIDGTVTAAAGGAGLSGVAVDVYDQSGSLVAAAATSSTGSYTATGLTPLATGYTVCFDARNVTGSSSATGYQSQCYKNVAWTAGAAPPAGTKPVPVAAGATATGISGALAPDGAIAGTVTAASGGTALGEVIVDVYDASGNLAGSAATAPAGTYTVPGLAPSTAGYTVCFDSTSATGGSSATGYQSQCFKNVAWTVGAAPPSGTKPVPVAAGKTTTGIAPALSAAGGISGTVTAAGGGGVSGVSVDVFNSAADLVTAATTASDGTYAVIGLAPSSYTVCFDASAISAAGLSSQCAKNIPWSGGGQPVPSGATPVHVSAGTVTAGVGAALTSGASISGTVTAASGGGLAEVTVDVFDSHGTFLTTASTASDGTYTIAGLTPSSVGYTICFDASAATGGTSKTGYADQCYKGVTWSGGTVPPSGTTLVKPSAGATATGISASLSPAGAISGTVTAKTGGAGLAGVTVRIYDSGGHLLTQQRTGAKGGYTLSGLAPSAGYRVCFDASAATGGTSKTGYADQCYKGVAWHGGQSAVPKTASAVPVSAGKTTAGVSAALASGASISGTVTAATGGGALTGVSIDVFTTSGTLVAVGAAAANGTYTVTGLAAASYTVCFAAAFASGGSSTAGYASQCYKNVAWSGTAAPPKGTTLVKLAAAAAAKGINAKLRNA